MNQTQLIETHGIMAAIVTGPMIAAFYESQSRVPHTGNLRELARAGHDLSLEILQMVHYTHRLSEQERESGVEVAAQDANRVINTADANDRRARHE